MPATAPVDNPVDFSDIVDVFVDPFGGVLVGAVLVVNAVEVLGGIEEVVLNDAVIQEVMLEDKAELLDDVVATVDGLEDVLDGAKVETVAPKVPRVTISVLKGTWNRPIPESQHPLV
jgi:Na+/pantothenate symporter